jgi:hypothetical protein
VFEWLDLASLLLDLGLLSIDLQVQIQDLVKQLTSSSASPLLLIDGLTQDFLELEALALNVSLFVR